MLGSNNSKHGKNNLHFPCVPSKHFAPTTTCGHLSDTCHINSSLSVSYPPCWHQHHLKPITDGSKLFLSHFVKIIIQQRVKEKQKLQGEKITSLKNFFQKERMTAKDTAGSYHKTNIIPNPPISPMRMMCGQCCSVLAKNGLVTPKMTGGLWKWERDKKKKALIKGNKKHRFVTSSVLDAQVACVKVEPIPSLCKLHRVRI